MNNAKESHEARRATPGNRFVGWPKARERRETLRQLGLCINSSLPWVKHAKPVKEHGPPVSVGGKCKACCDVHARSR